jgi:hypothetical protein
MRTSDFGLIIERLERNNFFKKKMPMVGVPELRDLDSILGILRG